MKEERKMSRYPEWYYDELKQPGTDYSDMEEVRTYDEHMQKVRNLTKENEQIILEIQPDKSKSVLEIGSGTGEFAIEVSKYCKRVFAVDVSKAMLEYAGKKAEKKGRKNIEFFHGGFLTYEHQGEPVDIVVSQIVLHHLPDFWKMMALRRVFNILKKGGIFYLRDVVFPSEDDYEPFFNALLDNIGKVDRKLAGQTAMHIKEEYSTLDWIMEGLLERAGFSIGKTYKPDGMTTAYLCVKE
jgi:putative AdoMet-dependent methyltransferase